MKDVDLIVFQVARTRIEMCDWAWVADLFNADAMPQSQLRAWFGRVMWCVDGYDSDPSELYAIPEVRKFLAAWHLHRPHWLFFGSLETDNLKVMYVSLLGEAISVRHNAGGLCQVSYDRRELGRLLADDLEIADRIAADSYRCVFGQPRFLVEVSLGLGRSRCRRRLVASAPRERKHRGG